MSEQQTEASQPIRAKEGRQALSLIVENGGGASARLGTAEGSRLVVGQGRDCDLVIADRTASRRHFELTVISTPAGSRARLRDLGSTNGTWVDGVQIIEGYVDQGSLITAGATRIRVVTADSPLESDRPEEQVFGQMVGASPQVRRLFPLLHKLAQTDVPVLIQGETGTGKEVLAESIHDASRRASGPFVVFDCTTVHANLLEAALFGHEKGAFTGATQSRAGVFENAEGGTLLIDEIGDLELPLQGKLLRAIERAEVQRVGSLNWRKFDVRVLAATRRNLDVMIQEGKFRDDLFYRLAVGRVELPPLRERRGDVELLVKKFADEMSGSEEDIAEFLSRHQNDSWPGNIRELKNSLARFLALGDLAEVGPEQVMAGDPVKRILSERLPYTKAKEKMLAHFQAAYVEDALKQHAGNVTQAARTSGLARRYFQKLNALRRDDVD